MVMVGRYLACKNSGSILQVRDKPAVKIIDDTLMCFNVDSAILMQSTKELK